MKAAPFFADLKATATMARTMAKKVVTTAASCGLFPNGAATKNDQLARERPKRTCIMTMRPTLLSAKMRKAQSKPTMIHAGRYVREMERCQELGQDKGVSLATHRVANC